MNGRMHEAQKKIQVTVYRTPGQIAGLDAINAATKVPTAERIREGIDLILKAHADILGEDVEQLTLPGVKP